MQTRQNTEPKSSRTKIGCLFLFLGGVFVLWNMDSFLGLDSNPEYRRTYSAEIERLSRASGKPLYDKYAGAEVTGEPQLELVKSRWYREYGYATMVGQVRNISPQPLRNIEVVTTFYDENREFIVSDDALIEYNPILPGQVSSFKTMTTFNPAMKTAGVEFKELTGGSIRHRNVEKQ